MKAIKKYFIRPTKKIFNWKLTYCLPVWYSGFRKVTGETCKRRNYYEENP